VKYWTREPYMGFGLDAHSMLRRADGSTVRFANARELSAYDAGLGGEVTPVGADAAFEEAVFLGLRLVEGVSMAALRREFGSGRVASAEEAATELATAGLLAIEDDRWKLTLRGRLVSNEVFAHLLMQVGA
jgi:oxygen-independent coproporphyrinogen-3 oxidase